MQLKYKVIKKWHPFPFLHQPFPRFQGYPSFVAKFLVLTQVTQSLEGPTSPLIRKAGGVPTMLCVLCDISAEFHLNYKFIIVQ